MPTIINDISLQLQEQQIKKEIADYLNSRLFDSNGKDRNMIEDLYSIFDKHAKQLESNLFNLLICDCYRYIHPPLAKKFKGKKFIGQVPYHSNH